MREANIYNKCRVVEPHGGAGMDASALSVYSPLSVALCAPVCREKGVRRGAMEKKGCPTQGGVGIDHLAQVQQKNAQTDTLFVPSASFCPTISVNPADYPTSSPITTLKGTVRMAPNCGFSQTPGVLTTRKVTSASLLLYFSYLFGMDVSLRKDRKGSCYILSHRRCGITESMFLTDDELLELSELIYDIFETEG